jgi:hypothetical protein
MFVLKKCPCHESRKRDEETDFFQEPFQESWLDHAEKRKPALSRERRYPRGATRDEKEAEKSA